MGSPGGSIGKNLRASAGDTKYVGLIPVTRILHCWQEDALEKEMVTYSSILAWEISRTEGPTRL